MRNEDKHYRLDVAAFIAKAAVSRKTLTYGELSEEFGVANQGCGKILSSIACRCRKHGLPILSVLVVSKDSGLPSMDAKIYPSMGFQSPQDLEEEQKRCFEFNWSDTPFGRTTIFGGGGE